MRLIAALAFVGLLAPPAAAAEELRCVWRELPTVVKARLELSARLGQGVPVSVVNRFGKGGLAKHLTECGLTDSFDDFQRASAYWLATASWNVARTRARLAGVDVAALEGDLERLAPPARHAEIGAAIMARVRGPAEPVLLRLLDALDARRAAAEAAPLQAAQKRLAVEYAVARLILLGLDAGAPPPAPKPVPSKDRENAAE